VCDIEAEKAKGSRIRTAAEIAGLTLDAAIRKVTGLAPELLQVRQRSIANARDATGLIVAAYPHLIGSKAW